MGTASTRHEMSDDTKQYSLCDKGIKLVRKPSDLDPSDIEDKVLRAVLSCGHVTRADTLTDCCKVQVDKGQTYFECPIDVCNGKWSYGEVRKLAKLTPSERLYFEKTLGENTAKLAEIKNCPGCGANSKRTDIYNLCVQCKLCTAKKGRAYEFCWQCGREWKGRRPRADRCDNEHCIHTKEEILRHCPVMTLESVKNVQCPSIRACPFPECQVLLKHTGKGCKMLTCGNCKEEFCFICLKSAKDCLLTIGRSEICEDGVAPRQT